MFCKGCGQWLIYLQHLSSVTAWLCSDTPLTIEQFMIKRCRWPVTSAGNNETWTMATYGTTGQPFEPTPAICKQVQIALLWSMLDDKTQNGWDLHERTKKVFEQSCGYGMIWAWFLFPGMSHMEPNIFRQQESHLVLLCSSRPWQMGC